MAKRRPGPIVALLLLVVLGAWVYFKEYRKPAAGKDAGQDRLIAFERADLKAIAIKNDKGEIRLEKQGETWRITAPLAAEADKDAVEGLLTSLEMTRVERRLGAEADRKPYGLDPPRASLTLDLASIADPRALHLGDGTPIGGTFFASVDGAPDVVVVTSSAGDIAGKDLLGLRDKSLLSFDPWKIRKLEIRRGRETVLLENPSDGWVIRRPIEAPADGPTVTDLLNALEGLRARSFVTERPTGAGLRRHGLAPPAARLTILQEGWDVEKTVLIGGKVPKGGKTGASPDDGRYARTVGRDPVITIPGDFWEKVTTRLVDLRRKELLALNRYRIEKITAARAGGAALVLSREKDGKWSVSGLASGTVKGDSVDDLLGAISQMKSTSFNDRAAEAQRAALSRKPAFDLTLQEETDAAGGSPKSQHLVIGAAGRSGNAPARDMAWKSIAEVPGGVLAQIAGHLDALQKEAAAPTPAPAASEPAASPDAPAEPPATSPGD
jgi:hypothetical protein